MVSARIISIGDELLCGRTVDTNASRTQRRLLAHGVPVHGVAVVPDTPEAIAVALDAVPEGSLVVMTGGLGPTPDDLTVDAVAAWSKLVLEVHLPTDIILRERAADRGIPFGPNMVKQTLVPVGFEALNNPAGTAPGLIGDALGRLLVLLPGVPIEVDALWPQVEQALIRRGVFGDAAPRVLRRTCGLSEPEVDRRTAPFKEMYPDLIWSWWLTRWGVDVQVSTAGKQMLPQELCARLDAVLGEHVFAVDMIELNDVVVRNLQDRGWTLALAESCTGGLVGGAITDVPGASSVFLGGAVSYADMVKSRFLDVPQDLLGEHGAVSEPVARAMAVGARSLFGSDVAMSVTGIAGPDGGTPGKPVGTTCIGLASPFGVWSHRLRFQSFRIRNRELAVAHVLDALRRHLASGRSPWPDSIDQ